jgi:hypothetical protein
VALARETRKLPSAMNEVERASIVEQVDEVLAFMIVES